MNNLLKPLILIALSTAIHTQSAAAQCASDGTRVRCVYAGPSEITQHRSKIGARFVTATRHASVDDDGHDNGLRRVRRVVWPLPQRLGHPDHIYRVGETLPKEVLILIDPLRYGLPRPRDGWTYFQLGQQIYRAEMRTRRVLNHVNPHLAGY